MQNYPKVSVIIINWNGVNDTIDCLESLKKITYPNFDVVVVDNGSKGSDADILENKYKGFVKIIRSKENLGFAGGVNISVQYALDRKDCSDYVFLLNNDALIEPDCLDICVKKAKESRAGIVGAVIKRTRDGKIFLGTTSLINEFFGMSLIKTHFPDPLPSFWEVQRVQGSAMMIDRELLEQSKKERGYYLKPDYFLYWEEAEFCCYARKRGYKVIVARDAVVNHYDAKSSGHDSPLTYYYLTRNRIFLTNQVLPWYLKILFHIWYGPTRFYRILQKMADKKNNVAAAILEGLFDGYIGKKGKWRNHKG